MRCVSDWQLQHSTTCPSRPVGLRRDLPAPLATYWPLPKAGDGMPLPLPLPLPLRNKARLLARIGAPPVACNDVLAEEHVGDQ
eukprot:4439825-Heterocapsa_arctica.AAC.1